MSFPRYGNYRESRVQWLDEIPAHWGEGRLRWLATRYAGGTPDKSRMDYWDGGTIPWLNSGAVNQGLITEPSAFITDEALANSSARWVPENALVLALAGQGKTKGMVAQVSFRSTCNQSMAAIVPGIDLQPRYLYWWLAANYQNIRNMAGGDLRDGLNLEHLGDISCPLPSSVEQTAIAAFLDHETSKIDELVQEQRRLVDLLKEKRQALISHAVTRGFDPNAPMKDSGIEGLGKVPAHWDVVPLKRVWSVTDCKHITAEFVDDGYPLASIREVQARYVELSEAKRTTEDFYRQLIEGARRPEPGDLIFSRNATVGEVAEVAEWHPPFAMGQDVCLLRRHQKSMSPGFLRATLQSAFVREQLERLMLGATFKRVNVEDIRNLMVAAPPHGEQTEIASRIEQTDAQLSSMIREAELGQRLLAERRAALISAAVTGKIDVRQVAKDCEQAEAA